MRADRPRRRDQRARREGDRDEGDERHGRDARTDAHRSILALQTRLVTSERARPTRDSPDGSRPTRFADDDEAVAPETGEERDAPAGLRAALEPRLGREVIEGHRGGRCGRFAPDDRDFLRPPTVAPERDRSGHTEREHLGPTVAGVGERHLLADTGERATSVVSRQSVRDGVLSRRGRRVGPRHEHPVLQSTLRHASARKIGSSKR